MQNGCQRPTIFIVLPFPSLAFISANVLSAWTKTQSLDHWSVGDGNRTCVYILSLVACRSPASLICPLPPTSPTPPECFCAVIPERAGKKGRLWSPIFPILSAISSMLCRKLFHWVNSSTPPPLHRMLSPSSDCYFVDDVFWKIIFLNFHIINVIDLWFHGLFIVLVTYIMPASGPKHWFPMTVCLLIHKYNSVIFIWQKSLSFHPFIFFKYISLF